MSHILIAVDLSEPSRIATRYAASMAKSLGAELTLLHVDETPALNIQHAEPMIAFQAQVAKARAARLEAFEATLDPLDVPYHIRTEAGAPSKQICEVAEDINAALIVITRRGLRQAEGPLLGSTTKRVLRQAPCPVLVFQEDAPVVDEGLPSFKKILTTTDFSTDSQRGLSWTLDLAARLQGEVTVVHALQLPLFVPVIPGEPPLHVPRETVNHLHRVQQGELEQELTTLGRPEVKHRVIYGQSVAEAVIEAANLDNVDLITIPSHGKGAIRAFFLGSTTEDVIAQSSRPVLVMPRRYLEQHTEDAA